MQYRETGAVLVSGPGSKTQSFAKIDRVTLVFKQISNVVYPHFGLSMYFQEKKKVLIELKILKNDQKVGPKLKLSGQNTQFLNFGPFLTPL